MADNIFCGRLRRRAQAPSASMRTRNWLFLAHARPDMLMTDDRARAAEDDGQQPTLHGVRRPDVEVNETAEGRRKTVGGVYVP